MPEYLSGTELLWSFVRLPDSKKNQLTIEQRVHKRYLVPQRTAIVMDGQKVRGSGRFLLSLKKIPSRSSEFRPED